MFISDISPPLSTMLIRLSRKIQNTWLWINIDTGGRGRDRFSYNINTKKYSEMSQQEMQRIVWDAKMCNNCVATPKHILQHI